MQVGVALVAGGLRDSGSGQGHRRRSSGSMDCMAMLVDGKKHGGAWEAARQLG